MKFINSKKIRQVLFLFLVIGLARANGQDFMEESQEKSGRPFGIIREKYEELPPAGKFAACAAIGFCGSRAALKTFVGAAKVAGAAFIATEVLSMSGVLDDMPSYIDDHVQTVASVKDRILSEASKYRKGVREALKGEKMAALGFATGGFVAMVI